MIDEVKGNYIENPNEASFMIVAYAMQDSMKEKLPSTVHVDGTIRPQAVRKESNPLYRVF